VLSDGAALVLGDIGKELLLRHCSSNFAASESSGAAMRTIFRIFNRDCPIQSVFLCDYFTGGDIVLCPLKRLLDQTIDKPGNLELKMEDKQPEGNYHGFVEYNTVFGTYCIE
jgi:hypothetical protein